MLAPALNLNRYKANRAKHEGMFLPRLAQDDPIWHLLQLPAWPGRWEALGPEEEEGSSSLEEPPSLARAEAFPLEDYLRQARSGAPTLGAASWQAAALSARTTSSCLISRADA
jgi:hypothetical protein